LCTVQVADIEIIFTCTSIDTIVFVTNALSS